MRKSSLLQGTIGYVQTTFRSLENRDYRWYWMSTLAASAAMQMQMVIRGWLVYDLTNSAEALGLVSFSAGIPILLLSPFGGAITDRVDKRNLLIITQALTGIATLIIAVLITTEMVQLWHLILASIANGVILSFNIPGRQAIVPYLVSHRQLTNAVALNSGSHNLNRIVAPAIAGVLAGISIISIDGVYYIIAAFSLLSIASLSRLPYFGAPTRHADATFGGDIIEGFRYVRQSPALLGLLTMAIVPILFGMPYMMLMPIFADDVLHIGAIGLGYLMAATGIGALFGSLLVASLSDFRRKGMLLFVTAILFGVSLILFSQSNTYEVSMFFLLGVGASSSIYMAVNNSLILLHTEEKYRGRVMSLYMMTIGIMPVAVLPAGILIDRLRDPGLVVGAGGVILIVFTLMVMLIRPHLRRL